MWYEHKFFKYAFGLLLILVNIYFLGKIDYFLIPLRNVLGTIFFPLLISGLLYYLLRPLVNLLVRLRIPRTLSIIILFLLLLGLITFLSASTGSMLVEQASQLYNNAQGYVQIATQKTVEFFENGNLSFIPFEELQQQFAGFMSKLVPILSQSILSGIAAVANIATVLVIVPFILFYLLKDYKLFHKHMLNLIPKKHREHGDEILDDIDRTLSSYIIGQAIMALFVGLMTYIGYLILGLDFALILALFTLVTAFIPILGAFIGVIPAMLVGLTVNPLMALKVLILMIIVQQIEGNLLSPQLMGKRMKIHPLTFIIILLAAASLAGFIGMLIAVPVYAVLKIIGKKGYEIYRLDKENG